MNQIEGYSFDELTHRSGTGCYKWDTESPAGPIGEDVIPMWVADMDFKVAPAIAEALRKRVEHQVFGYTSIPDSYYGSAISWWERRRGWKTEKEWYLCVPGVVPAMAAVIKALTQFEIKDGKAIEREDRGRGPHGELPKVIVQTPAYNCFFSSIRNAGCDLSENKLIYDLEGDQATWYINFEDLEKKAADPMAKMLLLCNPHNPCGRIWTKNDLERIVDICRRNDVILVSDEIHCELEMPGYHFIPAASISEEAQAMTVTLNSPSKSFNTAGLQIANIITSNPEWRAMIDKVVNIYEICDVNPFGVVALQAAYNEGEAWLEELNGYIFKNYRSLLERFEAELPQCPVTKLEGTYLVWVDVKALNMPSEEIERLLLENKKVWINAGSMYGLDGFIRINIACPKARMEEGVDRIVKGLKKLMKK